GNVLCCGFGEREIFKIADFGVARASGLQHTFEGLCAGTVGYSAPEAAGAGAGPPTDVFAFAAVVYYLLTGQRYFAADSPIEALHLILSASRPRIADHPTLSPELAQQPDACSAIDQALAQATLLDPKKRPESPERFAAELLTCLGAQNSGPRSSRQLLSALQSSRSHNVSYRFVARQRPRSDLAVLSASWDVDGHALALLVNGGCFWNGDTWLDAAPLLSKLPGRQVFTQLHEAGGWLVGGEALSVIDARGVRESLGSPSAGATFLLARGRLDDLLLALARDATGNLALLPIVARRFLRPILLPQNTHVSNLQRLGDNRFLVAGRRNGKGFVSVVSPLDGEIRELATPDVRSFIGGAPVPEQPAALVSASAGLVLRVEGDVVTSTWIPGAPDVSAVATDVFGREWASSLGTIWTRDPSETATWSIAWQDPTWSAPFISLLAQPGLMLAMTADGGIIEGRAQT
ncbi:MAG TPA: hypothetical protein VMS65_00160, partial [Polyangiaceae bacterium]|nr:hypothetical protein [Polyangiaceae bacterium]